MQILVFPFRHKLKQERKGAKKEIRKDVAFLASVKVSIRLDLLTVFS
jgi:hypothetical protein